jgi:4-hydroxy-tetrahydrodipicolinate synthase
MQKVIKGTGVALVTPFHPNGSIDFKSLDKLVKHLHQGKVDFLVALGTTAETATLNDDEKSAVLNTIIESNEGLLPIVVGMGSNNTHHLIHEIKALDASEIDGLLSVSPYYNKPNQKGIIAHFKEVAMSTDLPIILYNVPGRTSSNIKPATCLELADRFHNIIGIKEASGDMMQVMEIIKNRPQGFKVFSGDDALTLPMIAAGADGVISVVANAYPAAMSEMVNLMLSDSDRYKAMEIHYQLLNIINALFADGNPGGIKALLEHMGILGNNLRLPLVRVNRSLNAELKLMIQNTTLR